eukprot:6126234-Amphidinium_carterae.1
MCESITGLGYATVVPYKGVNTEAVKAILRIVDSSWRMDYRARYYSLMERLRLHDNFLMSNHRYHRKTVINHKEW